MTTLPDTIIPLNIPGPEREALQEAADDKKALDRDARQERAEMQAEHAWLRRNFTAQQADTNDPWSDTIWTPKEAVA